MKQTYKKYISIFFAALSGLLTIVLFILLFKFQNQYALSTPALILWIMSICLSAIIAFHCSSRYLDHKYKRKYIWTFLFVLYLLFLIYLLFFSRSFARDQVDLQNFTQYYVALQNQWEKAVNFIPFDTIKGMLWAMRIPSLFQFSMINLLGNLVAFMPFAFFYKMLAKQNTLLQFMKGMCIIILFVEITQFFTLTGSMDVDDFILNFSGALLCYGILQLPFLQAFFKRIHN